MRQGIVPIVAPVSPPVYRALGYQHTDSSFMEIGGAGIKAESGDLLVVALTMEDTAPGHVVVSLDGDAFTLDLQIFYTHINLSIWSFRVSESVLSGSIVAQFTEDYYASMIAGAFTGLPLGVAHQNAHATFAGTTAPDSGLAVLDPSAPQAHYGAIGTYGRTTDTRGTWQDGMTESMLAGFLATHALVKGGYKCLSAPTQARARVTGQSSRESIAAVVSYA
jgi:hypothetical protein